MRLYEAGGKAGKAVRTAVIAFISLFAVITLIISFYGEFPNRIKGYVLAPESAAAGSDFYISMALSDSSGAMPVKGAKSKISFYINGRPVGKYENVTDEYGRAAVKQKIPAGETGTLLCEAEAKSSSGSFRFSKKFEITSFDSAEVVTDKLEYSPGDSVYVKCASDNPAPSELMSLSLFSSSGMLLYSDTVPVSEYGFALGTIPLGSMIVPGEYEIRAECGGCSSFKRIFVSDSGDSSVKIRQSVYPSYFASGGKNRITVSAEGRQGIAMRNAHISVLVSEKSGDSVISEKRVSGDTDDSGKFSFDYSAGTYEKEYLAENPVTVCISASVRKLDSEHAQTEKSFELSPAPFKISFFPEDSSLTPGIRNRVFVFASYPDGSPAAADIEGMFGNRIEKLSTNKSGFCEFWTDPSAEGGIFPVFKAKDSNGDIVSAPFDFSKYISSCSFSISSDRTCVKAGSPVRITLRNAAGYAPVTLLLVKGRDIISSKTVSPDGPESSVDFMIPGSADGLCRIAAVRRKSAGDPGIKTIDIFVTEGNLLSMKISLDKKSYHPGEIAEASFDADCDGGNEGFSGMISSKLISGGYGILREYFDGLPTSFSSESISEYLSSLRDQGNPDSPDVQEFFRFAFSKIEQQPLPLIFEDVAKTSRESFEMLRTEYYKGIFSWAMKISLIVSILAFAVLLFIALRDAVRASVGKNAPPEFEKDEAAGAFVLNFGVLMTAFITIFISLCMMSLRHITVNSFITSKMVIVSAGIFVFLLFLCELALAHSISCHSQKKLDLGFIYILRISFVFIAGILSAGALVITASANLWGIWGYETLFAGNIHTIEIAALCFLLFPAISLAITFLRLGKSENNRFYRPVFLSGLTVIAGVMLYFSCSGYRQFASSPDCPLFISGSRSASSGKELPSSFVRKPRADVAIPVVSSFTSSLDSFGMAFERFQVPVASGKMTLRSVAYTNKGISNPFEQEFDVSRPCMLSFSCPSFMTDGDCETVPFRVKNACSEQRDIVLSVTSEGALKASGGRFLMRLMPYEECVKNIMVKASGSGHGKVFAEASCGGYSEKRSADAEVSPASRLGVRSVCGRFYGPVSQKIRLSDKELASLTGASVRICPGILSNYMACSDAYAELNPITCPQAAGEAGIAAGALSFADPENKLLQTSLKAETVKSVQDVLACMNDDGSFSVVNGGPPDIWLTDSAIEAISEASLAVPCDPSAVRKAADWLFSKQQKNGSWENNLRLTAKTLYSLSKAGLPENRRMRDAYSFLKKKILASSDPFALAYAALYAAGRDRDTFDRTAAVINKHALHTHEICCWRAGEGLYSCVPGLADDIQATALCMRVMVNAKGYDDVSKRALAFIMSSRRGDGTWGSREASCEALRALSDLLAEAPEGASGFCFSVNGHDEYFIYGRDRSRFVDIDIKPEYLASENEIKISCPQSCTGAYIVSMDFKDANKGECLSGLKIVSKANAHSIDRGGVLALSVSVSNSGDSEFRNLILSFPSVPGFAFIEKPGDRMIKSQGLRSIWINRIPPGEKFSKTLYLRSVQECSVSIPPAFAYSVTNPYERVYGNSARIRAVENNEY